MPRPNARIVSRRASSTTGTACRRLVGGMPQRLAREDFAIAEPLYRRAAELDPGLRAATYGAGRDPACSRAYFLWTERPTDPFAEGLASARAGARCWIPWIRMRT